MHLLQPEREEITKGYIMYHCVIKGKHKQNRENINKNAFQSKANFPLAGRKSNTYNLTLE